MSAGILERLIAAAVAPLRAELDELRAAQVVAVKAAASPDDWISVAEAAAITGDTIDALRKRIARGKMPHRKVGRAVLVRRGDL